MSPNPNPSPDDWRDLGEAPTETPVIAQYCEWDKPGGELREHVVWFFDGAWRSYPRTDDRAYANRWRPMPALSTQTLPAPSLSTDVQSAPTGFHERDVSLKVALPAPGEVERLIEYLFGDQRNGDGVRVVDLCFTAFTNRDKPNPDDGEKSDWFTDTKPLIDKGIAALKDRLLAALSPTLATVAAANDEAWPSDAVHKLGAWVQKKGRASWRGRIVGWYRTDITSLGYAVESAYEPGSVQIYPETALLPLDDTAIRLLSQGAGKA